MPIKLLSMLALEIICGPAASAATPIKAEKLVFCWPGMLTITRYRLLLSLSASGGVV